jgi:hypothetical protein
VIILDRIRDCGSFLKRLESEVVDALTEEASYYFVEYSTDCLLTSLKPLVELPNQKVANNGI